ncbi:MAG: NTP transferase domain-containing protein [Bacteroidales bacterium]|nr:NTP transferase domain-containing protein [Bacteroidales bacterium]
MKSLILAAGYATRLYPLTKDFPKPLLDIGGKTIIDRLLADIDSIEAIDEHLVVTNDTFYTYFKAWQLRTHYQKPVTIINDGAICNENRKGAVCDILYVIEKMSLKDDLLVLAGDNVVDFSFKEFIQYALDKGTSCVTCHHEPSMEALRKTGVLVADDAFKVVAMFEKPQMPPSQWAVPPFYFYRGSDLAMIYKAVAAGCGFDAPGHLVAWLCNHVVVHAWELTGKRYDIGDMSSYEAVNAVFSQKTNQA